MLEPVNASRIVVIVTALDMETRAVLRHIANVSTETVSGTVFYRGQFDGWDVAVVEVGAGNATAAAITTRACDHYQPSVALFVGVAGGVKDVVIGDVVVATKVYGYESGKDTSVGIEPRPSSLNSAHALIQHARSLHHTENWRARLNPEIDHESPSIWIGPVAAGEKVVASIGASTAQLLREHYSDTLAVEMEGRGFLEAVHISSYPVQGCVIRGISDLLSGKAIADQNKSQERAADAAAAVAFQILAGFVTVIASRSNSAVPENAVENAAVNLSNLKALAGALLEAGMPPSIATLFPGAPVSSRAALESAIAVERIVIDENSSKPSDGPGRISIPMLAFTEQRRHLILGPPGSGKTRALWHAANKLLRSGDVIPLFLPAGQLNNWEDLVSMICEATQMLTLENVLRDPRVCILIDGWSEFAVGEYAGEKQRALRALRNTRVIANGKFSDVGDTPFKIWSLELLSPQQVADILEAARSGDPLPPGPVLDLLRLPLMLSIHILSGASASDIGELLRRFHDHIARDLPEGFTTVLAGAVAKSALFPDRAYGRLISDLQSLAAVNGITNPVRLLRQFGTIVERNSQALPIHDLYWSWLAGRGLLADELVSAAIDRLSTRESYRLALQSGTRPQDADIVAGMEDDLVLAATLDARLPHPNLALAVGIERALSDSRLAVRCRGALAAFACGRAKHMKNALEALSAITSAGLYIDDLKQALQPQVLYPQRAIIADWAGSDGTNYVLDVIADRGGHEWMPWLEQMASDSKVSKVDALAAALSCAAVMPVWGKPHLDELFKTKPWALRATASRRSNLVLARHIAVNYERLIDTVIQPSSSAWIDLNRILVACSDDAVFYSLLGRFGDMSDRAQELLGYAIVERGQPWIEAFQRIAFAKEGGTHHHRLAEILSPGIDDTTARTWINAGHYEIGWRILIARHGETILPELIADLPASFADLHQIPSLAVMRFLDQAPPSLPDELLRRLGSPMQPKVMQDVLNAIAKSYPTGVPVIVRLVSQQPDNIPAYHIAQVLRLYEAWREKSGDQLIVQMPGGEPLTFSRWIIRHRAVNRWEDHFTPAMLSLSPELAVEIILNYLRDDIEKSAVVLEALKGLRSYDAELLKYMLATPKLAKLIPNVFAHTFDVFPETALQRCIESPNIDQKIMLYRLGSTSNPLHRSVHAKLIQRALASPVDLHDYRYIANMLRGHTAEDTKFLLRNTEAAGGDSWLWLVREVEAARGERLINESGNFRHHVSA